MVSECSVESLGLRELCELSELSMRSDTTNLPADLDHFTAGRRDYTTEFRPQDAPSPEWGRGCGVSDPARRRIETYGSHACSSTTWPVA